MYSRRCFDLHKSASFVLAHRFPNEVHAHVLHISGLNSALKGDTTKYQQDTGIMHIEEISRGWMRNGTTTQTVSSVNLIFLTFTTFDIKHALPLISSPATLSNLWHTYQRIAKIALTRRQAQINLPYFGVSPHEQNVAWYVMTSLRIDTQISSLSQVHDTHHRRAQ